MLKEYIVTVKVEVPIDVKVWALDEDRAERAAWNAINEPCALMEALDDVPRYKFDLEVEDVELNAIPENFRREEQDA